MELVFEWNSSKARMNLQKHKVTFEEARTLFNDPLLLTYPDESHSETEERYISIGNSVRNRVLVVVHTEREEAEDTLTSALSVAAELRHQNDEPMKKAMNNAAGKSESAEMLSEYDFTGKKGVRGKYYRAYRRGHTVRISQEDGTVSVQYFTLKEGAVMLESDVREYFPTSESVNQALRSLIMLIPKPRRRK
jgi:uncharacterized DUF497 family protein